MEQQWRKKKERRGGRKKKRKQPPAVNPASAAVEQLGELEKGIQETLVILFIFFCDGIITNCFIRISVLICRIC
jgi:hypothetical protein